MAAGKFVRHKVTGFEAYIPADHWDDAYGEEYHVLEPEKMLKEEYDKMMAASKRHDEAVAKAAERAVAKQPTPPKE